MTGQWSRSNREVTNRRAERVAQDRNTAPQQGLLHSGMIVSAASKQLLLAVANGTRGLYRKRRQVSAEVVGRHTSTAPAPDPYSTSCLEAPLCHRTKDQVPFVAVQVAALGYGLAVAAIIKCSDVGVHASACAMFPYQCMDPEPTPMPVSPICPCRRCSSV